MPPEAGPDWVEAEVIEVCRPDRPDHPLLRPHVVVLRERNGTRRLPMYTGSAEAIALACSLDAGEVPGLRIYQLAANLLTAAIGKSTSASRLHSFGIICRRSPGRAVDQWTPH